MEAGACAADVGDIDDAKVGDADDCTDADKDECSMDDVTMYEFIWEELRGSIVSEEDRTPSKQ